MSSLDGMTREQLLERAQLLQQARELRAKEAPIPSEASPADRPVDAALEGFGQGLTMGHLSQLQALAEPSITGTLNFLTGNRVGVDPSYVNRRDQAIASNASLEKQNPKTALAAKLAGGLTTGLAIPAASVEGLAAKIGVGAASGAATGALQNPGDRPGVVDSTQISERLPGAATGAVLGAAAPVIPAALSAAKDRLASLAESQAFKALGPYARQARQAFARDKVNSIGRSVLDAGVVGGLPTSIGSLAARAESAAGRAGKDVEQQLTSLTRDAIPGSANISRAGVAESMRKALIAPESQTDLPGALAKNEAIEKLIQQFENGGDEAIPLLEAEAKKSFLGNAKNGLINYDRLPGADIPLDEQVNRSLYTGLKSAGEKTAGDLAATKGSQAASQWKGAKNAYGNLMTAKDITSGREARQFANRLISPSDYGLMTAGAIGGSLLGNSTEEKLQHALEGASLGLVNHVGRKYGSQMVASLANALSKGAGGATQVTSILQSNPWLLPLLKPVQETVK